MKKTSTVLDAQRELEKFLDARRVFCEICEESRRIIYDFPETTVALSCEHFINLGEGHPSLYPKSKMLLPR